MRVLITGGAGFIGSHLAKYLQGRGEIRVLDNLRSSSRSNLNGTPVATGDPAGANALDARQQLGPGWQDAVNKTTWTCWN